MCACVLLFFTVRHKRLHSPSEIDMCEIKRRVNFVGFYIEMCYALAFSFHVFRIDRVRFTIIFGALASAVAALSFLVCSIWLGLGSMLLCAETEMESRGRVRISDTVKSLFLLCGRNLPR